MSKKGLDSVVVASRRRRSQSIEPQGFRPGEFKEAIDLYLTQEIKP